MTGSSGFSRAGLQRRSLLCAAASLVAPWTRALAEDVRLPRFSAATPGAGVPPGWTHETLPKVERPNEYDIVTDQGASVLRVRSVASASTLAAQVRAGAAQAASLRWRWRVSRALAGSDMRTKAGDDYAARVYVLFDLPPERLSLADRVRIQAARTLSGREIPAAAICYVWGTAQPAGSSGWNPYTDRVRMVVVDSGAEHAMHWRSVERNLQRDWLDAFPGPMPPVRGIAVGADTDNTGDHVQAWFGDLVLAPTP